MYLLIKHNLIGRKFNFISFALRSVVVFFKLLFNFQSYKIQQQVLHIFLIFTHFVNTN